jgi:hypothetical protein
LPLRIHKTSEMSGGVRHRLEVESDRVSDSRHRTDVSQTDLVETKKARPGPRDVQFVDEVLVGSGGGVVGPHVYRGDPPARWARKSISLMVCCRGRGHGDRLPGPPAVVGGPVDCVVPTVPNWAKGLYT